MARAAQPRADQHLGADPAADSPDARRASRRQDTKRRRSRRGRAIGHRSSHCRSFRRGLAGGILLGIAAGTRGRAVRLPGVLVVVAVTVDAADSGSTLDRCLFFPISCLLLLCVLAVGLGTFNSHAADRRILRVTLLLATEDLPPQLVTMLWWSRLPSVLNLGVCKALLGIVELIVDHPALFLRREEKVARGTGAYLQVGPGGSKTSSHHSIEPVDGCVLRRWGTTLHAHGPGEATFRAQLLHKCRSLVRLLRLLLLISDFLLLLVVLAPLLALGRLFGRRSRRRCRRCSRGCWRSSSCRCCWRCSRCCSGCCCLSGSLGGATPCLAECIQLAAVCLNIRLRCTLLKLDITETCDAHRCLKVAARGFDRGLEVYVTTIWQLELEVATACALLMLDFLMCFTVRRRILRQRTLGRRRGKRFLLCVLRYLLLFLRCCLPTLAWLNLCLLRLWLFGCANL
mmetsp:Transcript_148312/g.360043  ORF Transcript_148312/g.360043 Transcript_148312/m.360043 type:complete len:457 (-) Transcript_148312:117-1487(-)